MFKEEDNAFNFGNTTLEYRGINRIYSKYLEIIFRYVYLCFNIFNPLKRYIYSNPFKNSVIVPSLAVSKLVNGRAKLEPRIANAKPLALSTVSRGFL